MKQAFIPYYLSRSAISILFPLLVIGFKWSALPWMLLLFGGFLLYLHSGWFVVYFSRPLFPLRRDQHGLDIQRKALIAGVGSAILLRLISSVLIVQGVVDPFPGTVFFALGVVVYLGSQMLMHWRNGHV